MYRTCAQDFPFPNYLYDSVNKSVPLPLAPPPEDNPSLAVAVAKVQKLYLSGLFEEVIQQCSHYLEMGCWLPDTQHSLEELKKNAKIALVKTGEQRYRLSLSHLRHGRNDLALNQSAELLQDKNITYRLRYEAEKSCNMAKRKLLNEGEIWLKKGEFQKAIDCLDLILAQDPENGRAFVARRDAFIYKMKILVAKEAFDHGKFSLAHFFADSVRKKYPEHSEINYIKEPQSFLATTVPPLNISFIFSAANAYLQDGDFAETMRLCDHLLKHAVNAKDEEDVKTLFCHAKKCHELIDDFEKELIYGDYEAALVTYEKFKQICYLNQKTPSRGFLIC